MIIEDGISIGITQETAEVQVEKFQEIIEPIGIIEPIEPDTSELVFYSQFDERELAYIQGSGEITNEYALIVLKYKYKDTLEAKMGIPVPLDILGRYGRYAEKRTSMTSREVLDVPITYKDWIAEDFAELWKSDEYNFGHDKCIYMMRKLGIFNKSEWSSLTGYVSKGARFLPEVSKNISNVIEGVSEFAGDVIGDVVKGALDIVTDITGNILEDIFGKNWKRNLIIGAIIVIVIIVLGLVGYSYTKTYVGAKATKKAMK